MGEEAAQNRRCPCLGCYPVTGSQHAGSLRGTSTQCFLQTEDHEVLTPPAPEHLPGCQTDSSGRVQPKMNISILTLLLVLHLPSQFLVSNIHRLLCVHLPVAAKSAQTRCSFPDPRCLPLPGRVTSLWLKRQLRGALGPAALPPWLQLPCGPKSARHQLFQNPNSPGPWDEVQPPPGHSRVSGIQLLFSLPPLSSPQPLRGHSASPSRKEARTGVLQGPELLDLLAQTGPGFPH